MSDSTPLREKLTALRAVAAYHPALTAGIICLSVFAALLEGIGLSFLVPIVEIAQGTTPARDAGGIVGGFVRVYDVFGIPFTLEAVVLGVVVVMIVRYGSSYLVAWLRAALRTEYIRHLQTEAFEATLDARTEYFDANGSEEIMNAIVTQATYAGRAIERVVKIVEESFLSLMYLAVALYIAPVLTVLTVVVLGGALHLIRRTLESGYAVGDRVAEANERLQRSVQAATQGIRDVKIYGVAGELFDDFQQAVGQSAHSSIHLQRNEAAIDNLYQLAAAITVFGLVYVGLTVSSLSLAGLGVFLFAMFRLAPRVSTLSNVLYRLDGDLPHLVRTQQLTEELRRQREPDGRSRPVPHPVERVAVDDVAFSYDTGETALDGVSLTAERGETVALVGPSGAGKSTIVSLIARQYHPDEGTITADGTDIEAFGLDEWRSAVALVRQDPYIFNDTVRYNVTLGNRAATADELRDACRVAQVSAFVEDLPNGFETVLGDDGVRLSGGQRQRISIARALLTPADVLLFDEATSDLDRTLEETIHDGVERSVDAVFLIVAHRLSAVEDADRIYAIDDGSVVEAGCHDDLVDRDGLYAELYADRAG